MDITYNQLCTSFEKLKTCETSQTSPPPYNQLCTSFEKLKTCETSQTLPLQTSSLQTLSLQTLSLQTLPLQTLPLQTLPLQTLSPRTLSPRTLSPRTLSLRTPLLRTLSPLSPLSPLHAHKQLEYYPIDEFKYLKTIKFINLLNGCVEIINDPDKFDFCTAMNLLYAIHIWNKNLNSITHGHIILIVKHEHIDWYDGIRSIIDDINHNIKTHCNSNFIFKCKYYKDLLNVHYVKCISIGNTNNSIRLYKPKVHKQQYQNS